MSIDNEFGSDVVAPDYVLGPPEGGEFAAMPLGRVHLVAGGSGSGKTTLIFQMLLAAQQGRPFLGFPTQWQPTVYVAFDRRPEETEETMRRVGLDSATVPHMHFDVTLPSGRLIDTRLEEVLTQVMNKYPGVKLIIMDAFFILAARGEINNYVIMAEWLQRAGKFADHQGIAILGIVHSPKQREGNRLIDPRYSATGSVATGGFTSCQIVLDTPSVKHRHKRKVHVFPRNAAEEAFNMVVDKNGLLQPDAKAKSDQILYLYGQLNKAVGPVSFGTLFDDMSDQGCSRATVARYLADMIAEGKVVRTGRGMYRVAYGSQGLPKGALGPALDEGPEDSSESGIGDPPWK